MSHFARIDKNGLVLQVVVVDNKDTADAFGVEKEHIGAAHLEKILGGVWKQTSYNGNMRKNYAGIGYTYRADIDAFVPPQPFASWILNNNTAQWEPPTPMPTDGKMYSWDEATTSWVELAMPGTAPAFEDQAEPTFLPETLTTGQIITFTTSQLL